MNEVDNITGGQNSWYNEAVISDDTFDTGIVEKKKRQILSLRKNVSESRNQ